MYQYEVHICGGMKMRMKQSLKLRLEVTKKVLMGLICISPWPSERDFRFWPRALRFDIILIKIEQTHMRKE